MVPVNIVIPLHPLRQKEFTQREATHQFRTSVLVLSGGLCLQVLKLGVRAKGTEKKEEVEEVLRDEEEKQSLKLHHRVQSQFPTLLIIVHFHIYGLKNENTLDKSRYSSIHTDITDVIVRKSNFQ